MRERTVNSPAGPRRPALRTLGPAGLELRRFTRGRLPRAALVALMLLPLLYGALYLWSFWNPYGHLDRLPVALVDQDRAVTVQGRHVSAGADLDRELTKRQVFDWKHVTAAQAARGVADGQYYLSLTIPADFSGDIAHSDSADPAPGELQVHTNDSNNYIVGQVSRSVFDEIRAAASADASKTFYDQIFVSFGDLHDQTVKAAQGADKVNAGADKAHQGAAQLANGADSAESGAQRLASGLDQAAAGSRSLAQGVGALGQGAAQLATGAGQAADGTQQLADAVNPVAKDLSPLLHRYPKLINTSATLIADHAQQIADDLGKLPAAAQQSVTAARAAASQLDAVYQRQCGKGGSADSTGSGTASGAGSSASSGTGGSAGSGVGSGADVCAGLRQADQAAHQVLTVATDVDGQVRQLAPELSSLSGDARHVAALAKPLEQPGLADRFDTAVRQVNALNSGVHQLATGAGRLSRGATTAQQGASSLATGLGTLDSGAHSLSGGLYRLADGADQLDSGLGTLAKGSGTLASSLHQGAGKIPDYDSGQRGTRAAAMSDPVQLAKHQADPVADYGTGFAPYFVPLALWVGAMVGYMLLRPLNSRALAANTPAWRVALAGWLPVAAIGLVQAAALLAVLHFGLGLGAVRAAGLCGYLALTVLCFTAVVQWLNARFGPAGRLLTLALLMLQLTSAGGTYPIQTSPRFFQALHPYLPMSYVVDGLRRLISGGDLAQVWQGCAVLAAFATAALALTTLTASRRQVWTPARLHPELTL